MDSVSAEFRQGEAQRYLFDFVTAVNSTWTLIKRRKFTRAKQHRRKLTL